MCNAPIIMSPKIFRCWIAEVLSNSHILGLTLAQLSDDYLAEMKKTSFGKNFKSMESVSNVFFGTLIPPQLPGEPEVLPSPGGHSLTPLLHL